MTTNPPTTDGLDMDTIHHRRSPALQTPRPTHGRSLLPITQAVLDAIRAHPRGVHASSLAAVLEKQPDNLSKTLGNLRQNGHIVNINQPGQPARWVCKTSPLLEEARTEALLAYRARMVSSMGAREAAEARQVVMAKPNGGRSQAANKTPERLAIEDCLALAGAKGRTLEQITRMTGLDDDTAQGVLHNMVSAQRADSVLVTNHRYWRLLSAVAKEQAEQQRALRYTPVRNSTASGLYVPIELRPYEGRPGAMDAFALPSRVGNELVQPRGIKAGCTGPAPSVPNSRGAPRMAK
jgi:hypothetical protein